MKNLKSRNKSKWFYNESKSLKIRKVLNMKLIYSIFIPLEDKYEACSCRTKLYAGARVSYC